MIEEDIQHLPLVSTHIQSWCTHVQTHAINKWTNNQRNQRVKIEAKVSTDTQKCKICSEAATPTLEIHGCSQNPVNYWGHALALKVKDTRVWDKDEWGIRLLLMSPILEERKKVKRKIHGKISLSCKRKKRNILRGHKIRRVFRGGCAGAHLFQTLVGGDRESVV